jgi:imidazoleglycerol phosphate synthase cyclase subunit
MIFSIDFNDGFYDFYIQADSSEQRGFIFGVDRESSEILYDLEYYVNGQSVNRPFLVNEEWVVLGIEFPDLLDFSNRTGRLNLNGPLTYNNISYNLATNLERDEALETRSWVDMLSLNVGGITDIAQVQRLLRAGADKVAVNSAAYSTPHLITDIAKRHGVQCVVASIDVRNDGDHWACFSHAGQRVTGKDVVSWARELEDKGAGEILITSIDRDGTMQGYDLALIDAVVSAVNIPVIASGGAGCYQHMVDAVKHSGASAVAAASIFHFTEQTPAEAKAAMANAGIPVRHPYRGC